MLISDFQFNARKLKVLSSIYSNEDLVRIFRSENIIENIELKKDRSLKGEIDLPIQNLCYFINSKKDLYTLSCCSGRIQIYASFFKSSDSFDIMRTEKHNGYIVLACHSIDEIPKSTELLTKIQNVKPFYVNSLNKRRNKNLEECLSAEKAQKNVKLLVEPLLLHICCRKLDLAFEIIKICRAAGLKECGIVNANPKKGYIIYLSGADRMTIPLEVINYGKTYNSQNLEIWLQEAQKMMKRNLSRLSQLNELFQRSPIFSNEGF